MTRACKLIARVLRGDVPWRALRYGFLNKWNYLSGSGNRRYEFERLYLDEADPWDYNASPYENAKYRTTLDLALVHCARRRNVLEVGCSVGVFSRLLAQHFNHVTAMDVSAEALRRASGHPERPGNVAFLQEDVRRMQARGEYDAIFFAEVLYYLRDQETSVVCRKIESLLTDGGIIVMVTGGKEWASGELYGNAWDQAFSQAYERRLRRDFPDVTRPFGVCIYAKKNQSEVVIAGKSSVPRK